MIYVQLEISCVMRLCRALQYGNIPTNNIEKSAHSDKLARLRYGDMLAIIQGAPDLTIQVLSKCHIFLVIREVRVDDLSHTHTCTHVHTQYLTCSHGTICSHIKRKMTKCEKIYCRVGAAKTCHCW